MKVINFVHTHSKGTECSVEHLYLECDWIGNYENVPIDTILTEKQ